MKLQESERPFISQPFLPVYDENARILILGSFPSVKSREMGFYYGHPRNRFWKVMAHILECQEPQTVDSKKEMLLANHIALFDVIESCQISGSSDSSIRNVKPADIRRIVKESQINAVFVNGKTAAKLYHKYQAGHILLPVVELPSTSPANAAYSLDRLTEVWKAAIAPCLI